MSLNILVFNVDHGLCVFIRTPNGYGVMVDIGRSDGFVPADWLAHTDRLDLTTWNGRRLAYLCVTHPHDDHVEGIAELKEKLAPAILCRHKDYDWEAILNPPDGDPSRNAKEFHTWQQTYNQPTLTLPDWGCDFTSFSLSPREASLLGGTTQNVLNNSSFVNIFASNQPGVPGWKVTVCGDNESAGLNALLEKKGFREAVAGTDILVTPHHGHSSGYSGEFMEAIGEPIVCISSAPAKDPHVDCRYGDVATGLQFNGGIRKHLTSRSDGHLWLELGATGYKFHSPPDSLVDLLRQFARAR